jgi:hypothetical protein
MAHATEWTCLTLNPRHGFESGLDATKVFALAEVAQHLGYHERPDFTDLDAKRDVSEPVTPARVDRLLELARNAASRRPLVLADRARGHGLPLRVAAGAGRRPVPDGAADHADRAHPLKPRVFRSASSMVGTNSFPPRRS